MFLCKLCSIKYISSKVTEKHFLKVVLQFISLQIGQREAWGECAKIRKLLKGGGKLGVSTEK